MATVADVLRRFKRDPLGVLDQDRVEQVCRRVGHRWRERELDPATTIALFVRQVIEGNCPCTEVPHLAGRAFTAGAYCQARTRLPLAVITQLDAAVVGAILPPPSPPPLPSIPPPPSLAASPGARRLWLGRHRTVLIDGTTFAMADADGMAKRYGVASGRAAGCSYPLAHLLLTFDAASGLLLGRVASPFHTGDLNDAPQLHAHLRAGDVLVGDEAFGSYAHLALLRARGAHGVFPVHHGRIVDFTPHRPHRTDAQRHQRPDNPAEATARRAMPTSRFVRSLGYQDQLVEWHKPAQRPPWLSQAAYDALPPTLLVRELRRTLRRPGRRSAVTLTMVTTLLDPHDYPAHAIRALRLSRWDVETDIRCLKTTMGMTQLRCRTEDGMLKEVAVFCLVYNLVRVVMLQAAARQEVAVDRVSFADALAWMRHARPGDALPTLRVNPRRPGRQEPRLCKRGPDTFPPMNKSRRQHRAELKNSGKSP